jgi:hypothetical protein
MNNNMVYLHNLHNLCIIKVQGGERIFKQNPKCVKKDNLQKIEKKIDEIKLNASWLYESYFRNTK